jgi:hypothetical protein
MRPLPPATQMWSGGLMVGPCYRGMLPWSGFPPGARSRRSSPGRSQPPGRGPKGPEGHARGHGRNCSYDSRTPLVLPTLRPRRLSDRRDRAHSARPADPDRRTRSSGAPPQQPAPVTSEATIWQSESFSQENSSGSRTTCFDTVAHDQGEATTAKRTPRLTCRRIERRGTATMVPATPGPGVNFGPP